jgi:TonB family protein
VPNVRPWFISIILAVATLLPNSHADTTPTLGTVILEFYVDEKGSPKDIRVVESTDPRYSQAAIKAALKWTLDEKFRKQKMKVPVHFTVPPEQVAVDDPRKKKKG